MKNSVFQKTMKNLRKHRNIKFLATENVFSIRTKLSNYKNFRVKFISKINEKNSNISE